jgi:type VI secretion system protein ImpK
MELQYLCLAFGFAGKYQVRDRGHSQLAEVQQDLYRRIREQRGVAPQELSLRWEGVQDTRNPLIRYVPWWVVGAAALVVLTVAFVVYNQMLRRAAAPVKTALSQLRQSAFAEAVSEGAPDPRLRERLAEEETARRVTITEQGSRTIVTVAAADMFRSGSATVNDRYVDLIRRIGRALEEVPGRVMVVGHTDPTPVSFRYADNFELSRARAASVVGILRETVSDGSRLQSDGAGDTQQIDTVNLARNRRVEIIHVRGS